MPRTLYALLVAIDDYPSPVPPLRGCVNDIEAFAAYLSDRVDTDRGVTLRLRTLKDAEATRAAIIDGFRTHLGQAGQGDVALFCYSGHGSQEQAPEEFWTLEPDHLDETLVCHDSRQEGGWDLADKELAQLIGEVAAWGPHVAVLLDCCHSGSGTRVVEMEETAVRRAPTDLRRRGIETFLVGPQAAAASRPRHVLLAACSDFEEAREYYGDGKHRGAFSFFLGDTLRSGSAAPTYRDLFARASALLTSQVRNQSPQLEAPDPADLNAVFLDGAVRPAPAAFTASFRAGGWSINGGAAHGIPAASGGQAELALFAFDAADVGDLSKAVATARVAAVGPASSRIDVSGDLDPSTTYKAVVIGLPTPPLAVRLEGDAAACDLARQALAKAGLRNGPSLFVGEAAGGDKPEFRLLGRDGQYVITRPGEDRPLTAAIAGLNQASARLAVGRLEHIARWTQTARLHAPASTIRADEVKVTVEVDGKDVPGPEIRLEYRLTDEGQWEPPSFKLSMTNTGKRVLYCALLDLTETFRIDPGLQEGGCVRLRPGETAWALGGEALAASVPDELWRLGKVELRDLLKLIVCTQEFDARLLQQDALDMPTKAVPVPSRDSTLNRLMRQVQSRDLGAARPRAIDDWQASEVSFTTVRPLEVTPVPSAGPARTISAGVQVHPHPAFRANARVSTTPLATRDLQGVSLPRLLIDDPTVCRPLAFTSTRSGDPGLSVLELTDIADPKALTPEAPLRVTVPVGLAPGEHVLPVAYDGEFFLPLGRADGRSASSTDVVLERLPPPLADRRSLTGAVKIFFHKVVSRLVGLDFPYPVLAAADVAADGTVQVIADAALVRRRVAGARRIAVFVHGIIGDTRSMVPSVQLARLADRRPLGELYDLILTFDYENLNTTIEENGRGLKKRLEEAGLGAGHGKVLDVVAHSMGGLVSRWFIEREGGNQVARRLVMLGTPNGGSPWPGVVDWATAALALGLNQLTALPWPATVLGALTALVEKTKVALGEMAPQSAFLKTLAASPDPGIPYLMLAGNTSLIPAATAAQGEKGSRLSRLLARLMSPALVHRVANPFFANQANDIAVAVTSMEAIAPGRAHRYDVRPVACDHVSYFRDEAGLRALARALEEG